MAMTALASRPLAEALASEGGHWKPVGPLLGRSRTFRSSVGVACCSLYKWPQDDAVPSSLFRGIEALIGTRDHVLHVAIALVEEGDADRDGRGNRSIVALDRGDLDRLPDPLGQHQGGRLIDFAQQNDEFLAPEAGGLVGGPDRAIDDLGDP